MHAAKDITPDAIRQNVIQNGDIVYYSAIENIWNGEYVRIKGYKRELSYWLSNMDLNENSKIELIDDHFLKDLEDLSFTILAQRIINKERTQKEKALNLVILESVRSISKIINMQEIPYIGTRYGHLVSQ